MLAAKNKKNHADLLLSWYDKEARTLPWRQKVQHGQNASETTCFHSAPYHVWLSEIMLQQTTVVTVIPYFNKFLQRWPTVEALAASSLDDVLTQWAGLGYYARARNLHKCAQCIVNDYNGIFPAQEKELLNLPGIGAYTSAAIASIAFGQRAVVVDGNVERVVSRLFQVEKPLPESKPLLRQKADELTPDDRAGDYAQAMMDLGARICTARAPLCLLCPVSEHCEAMASGVAADLPRRKKKAVKPRRIGACFMVVSDDGYVLLRRRPDKGLLAKMAEVPGTEWLVKKRPARLLKAESPLNTDWVLEEGEVQHIFTHFHLTLQVYTARIPKKKSEIAVIQPEEGQALYWVHLDDLAQQPLPSVMQKVLALGGKALMARECAV